MPSFTRSVVFGLSLGLALACKPSTPPMAGLQGRVFLSQSVTENGAARPLVEGTRLRLQFHEDARLSASAGCNTLGARYQIDGGALVLQDAAVTEIGCDPRLHAQDEWYFGFLGSRPSVAASGDSLVLDGGGTRIEYLDQEVATPDLPLAGPRWTVDTIIQGGAAMHAAWPAPATLLFREEGTVEVFTGCNSGSGNYRVDGETITFESVVITLRACEDEDLQRLEEAVLDVVGSSTPVEWEITVNRLSLRVGEVGLDLQGTRPPARP